MLKILKSHFSPFMVQMYHFSSGIVVNKQLTNKSKHMILCKLFNLVDYDLPTIKIYIKIYWPVICIMLNSQYEIICIQ